MMQHSIIVVLQYLWGFSFVLRRGRPHRVARGLGSLSRQGMLPHQPLHSQKKLIRQHHNAGSCRAAINQFECVPGLQSQTHDPCFGHPAELSMGWAHQANLGLTNRNSCHKHRSSDKTQHTNKQSRNRVLWVASTAIGHGGENRRPDLIPVHTLTNSESEAKKTQNKVRMLGITEPSTPRHCKS